MGNWGLSREEPRRNVMMGFFVRADGFPCARDAGCDGDESASGDGIVEQRLSLFVRHRTLETWIAGGGQTDETNNCRTKNCTYFIFLVVGD